MSLECQRCEDNFRCIYLNRRLCSEHCWRRDCFCISCQLYNIEEKSPSVYCQKCNFLSECYSYKHLGKVNGRDYYIVQRHCIDHCQLERCPHRDEVTVDLGRVIPPPDYSHLIQNGCPSETVDIHQQCVSPQQLEDRETSVPGSEANSRMVPRVSKENRGRSKGILTNKGAGGTPGSVRTTGGNRNAGTKYRLSARAIVGTRSTIRPCYRGM